MSRQKTARRKKETPDMRFRKPGRLCLDCGHLRIRVDLNGSGAYWCVEKAAPIEGPLLWRKACDKFTSDEPIT